MSELRGAYEACSDDQMRRGFLEAAIETSGKRMSDAAFCAFMEEIVGPEWLNELERLGSMLTPPLVRAHSSGGGKDG